MHIKWRNNRMLNATTLVFLVAVFGAGVLLFLNGAFGVKRDSYVLIVLPLLLIGIGFWTIRKSTHGIPYVTKPSTLFLALFLYFVGLGTVSQYMRVLAGRPGNYSESLSSAYLLSAVALVFWIIGYRLAGLVKHTQGYSPAYSCLWAKKRLRGIATGWGVLGAFLMLIFLYLYVGGVPALSGRIASVDASMRDLVAGEGHWISVMAFNANTMGLMYTGMYLALFGPSIPVVFLFVLDLLLFVAWGPRIYFVLPLAVVGLLYVRKFRPRSIWIFGAAPIGLISLVLFGWWRNRAVMQLNQSSIIDILADLFVSPEFREHLSVLSYRELLSRHYTGSNIWAAIVFTMLPNVVWTSVGIDKTVIFSESSAWIIAELVRGNTQIGIRSGIISELVMAYGVPGVSIAFLALGVLFLFLDRQAMRSPLLSSRTFLVYLLAVLFSFLLIGQIESTFTRLWYALYAFALTNKLSTHKILVRERLDDG
jgi:hypothetical protein